MGSARFFPARGEAVVVVVTEPVLTKRAQLILILMGVSGCGKSTIGHLLADRLGWPLLEGDEFHSAANVAKMRNAIPLNDADRDPWLAAIASHLMTWDNTQSPGIVTCSALKRKYRDRLVAGNRHACFVYLKGERDLIRTRLAARLGHFMPANLLDSQFAALEEPGTDEQVVTVSIDQQPADIVSQIITQIGLK